jgi:hypothetical protein
MHLGRTLALYCQRLLDSILADLTVFHDPQEVFVWVGHRFKVGDRVAIHQQQVSQCIDLDLTSPTWYLPARKTTLAMHRRGELTSNPDNMVDDP